MSRIDRRFAALKVSGPHRTDSFRHRGRSRAGTQRGPDARLGRCGRGHHRTGRAVFRSDGRWSGDPARQRARNCERCWPCRCTGLGGYVSRARQGHAGSADGVSQSDRNPRLCSASPTKPSQRAWMACCVVDCPLGGSGRAGAFARGRTAADPARRAHHRTCAYGAVVRGRRRVSCTMYRSPALPGRGA